MVVGLSVSKKGVLKKNAKFSLFANIFSFLLEAYPKGDAFKLIESLDKKTILDIYKMTGQLRMTEEEKKAKLQVKYNEELDVILDNVSAKGIDLKQLAKQYGNQVELT